MKTLEGKNFFDILDSCSFNLNSTHKGFSDRTFAKDAGDLMLVIEFEASGKITGLNNSFDVIDQMWVLENYIEGFLGSDKVAFFIFSYFGELEEDEEEDPIEVENLHINAELLLPILEELSLEHSFFSITQLNNTIALQDCPIIKKWYKEYENKNYSNLSEHPKEYYDKKFGPQTDKEKSLMLVGRRAAAEYDEYNMEKRIECYSKVIDLNPQNAYAFLNRGIAMLDYFKLKSHLLLFLCGDLKEERLKEVEALKSKTINDAESDFRKAISLHPYLKKEYDLMKDEGKIFY